MSPTYDELLDYWNDVLKVRCGGNRRRAIKYLRKVGITPYRTVESRYALAALRAFTKVEIPWYL